MLLPERSEATTDGRGDAACIPEKVNSPIPTYVRQCGPNMERG
jgi:hypothetical protein